MAESEKSVRNLLENENLPALIDFLFYNISISEFEDLLLNSRLSVLEKLLFIIFKNAESRKNLEIFEILDEFLFPRKYIEHLKDVIFSQLREIIQQWNIKTFFPILSFDLFSLFSVEEIYHLIKDKKLKFIDFLFKALSLHFDVLEFMVGPDRIFDVSELMVDRILSIEFNKFDLNHLINLETKIKLFISTNGTFSETFSKLRIQILETIRNKKIKDNRELFNLDDVIDFLQNGKDKISDCTSNFNDYKFLFKDIRDLPELYDLIFSGVIPVGSVLDMKLNIRDIENNDFLSSIENDLLLISSIKTLVPTLEFSTGNEIDESLFEVIVFIQTPDEKRLLTTLHYRKNALWLSGCRFERDADSVDKEEVEKYMKFFNTNPFQLPKGELTDISKAMELSLSKIRGSDFEGVIFDDWGTWKMGVFLEHAYIKEINS